MRQCVGTSWLGCLGRFRSYNGGAGARGRVLQLGLFRNPSESTRCIVGMRNVTVHILPRRRNNRVRNPVAESAADNTRMPGVEVGKDSELAWPSSSR
jgi:hypothetical protein